MLTLLSWYISNFWMSIPYFVFDFLYFTSSPQHGIKDFIDVLRLIHRQQNSITSYWNNLDFILMRQKDERISYYNYLVIKNFYKRFVWVPIYKPFMSMNIWWYAYRVHDSLFYFIYTSEKVVLNCEEPAVATRCWNSYRAYSMSDIYWIQIDSHFYFGAKRMPYVHFRIARCMFRDFMFLDTMRVIDYIEINRDNFATQYELGRHPMRFIIPKTVFDPYF